MDKQPQGINISAKLAELSDQLLEIMWAETHEVTEPIVYE